MGHKKLWDIKTERERIYALEEMSEEEGNRKKGLSKPTRYQRRTER